MSEQLWWIDTLDDYNHAISSAAGSGSEDL